MSVGLGLALDRIPLLLLRAKRGNLPGNRQGQWTRQHVERTTIKEPTVSNTVGSGRGKYDVLCWAGVSPFYYWASFSV